MSKYTSFFALAVVTLSLSFSLFTGSVTANAQSNITGNIVSAKVGDVLNLRDKNCKKVGTLNSKEAAFLQPVSDKITCTVNSVKYSMIEVSIEPMTSYYVAENLVVTIGNISDAFNGTFTVNSLYGLNVRDNNCNKLGVVTNNTRLKAARTDNVGVVCIVNGKNYQMMPIEYKGRTSFVASLYTK